MTVETYKQYFYVQSNLIISQHVPNETNSTVYRAKLIKSINNNFL